MATTLKHVPGHADLLPHGLFGRVGTVVSNVFGAIADARRMAERYDQLSRLGPEELAQMGLTREDIPRAAIHRH